MSGKHTRVNVKPPARSGEQKRARIAAEAARIIAEEGVQDFLTAKRKAIARVSGAASKDLPTNEEIDVALADHLRLFHGARVAGIARRLRQLAAEAMNFLAPFQPRLVGPVLSGTVTSTSEIQLHISADTPEQVAFFLNEHGVPYEQGERRIKFGGERYMNLCAFSFVADGVTVELCVFDPRAARETPLSPIDGRPMRRAGTKEVESLLAT